MKRLKSYVLFVLVSALVVAACGCALGGPQKIGKDAALQTALDDAGLTADQVADIDVELERNIRSSWYEVDFESGSLEYEYKVNAYSGEILSSATD